MSFELAFFSGFTLSVFHTFYVNIRLLRFSISGIVALTAKLSRSNCTERFEIPRRIFFPASRGYGSIRHNLSFPLAFSLFFFNRSPCRFLLFPFDVFHKKNLPIKLFQMFSKFPKEVLCQRINVTFFRNATFSKENLGKYRKTRRKPFQSQLSETSK